MGSMLRLLGGLIMVGSVAIHVVGYFGVAYQKDKEDSLQADLVRNWNPQNQFLDSPALSTAEKQELVLAVGDRKQQVLGELRDRRESEFDADRYRLLNVMIGGLLVGALLFKIGQLMSPAASVVKSASDGQAESDESDLLQSDRKGNPFKKGEVSEVVLPRGDFWKKRNKFRKVIDRPNSEGY